MLPAMRQKTRLSLRSERPIEGDPSPIDLGDTARQIGLFETGNGWQHGIFGILLALIVALLWWPIRAFLRSGWRDGAEPPARTTREKGEHRG
jgi:hypothetical protein